MMEREEIALKILIALVSNSSRYDYITMLIDKKKITQEEANMKNINKAFKMADSFIKKSNSNQ